MSTRKRLLAGCAAFGVATAAAAQGPAAAPTGVAASPVPAAIGDYPPPPGGLTVWDKLGISQQKCEYCKRKICKTPLGQMLNNMSLPVSAFTGGIIPQCCPITPSQLELADKGAVGAAAAIQKDEAEAKARRAAVRYLGTVDCHYWPEAQDALIVALREDRNECVRYEAALALGNGCCCTKKTIEALNIVVACADRDGNPKETSPRVHAASHAALAYCVSCFVDSKKDVKPDRVPETDVPRTPEVVPVPDAPVKAALKPASGGEVVRAVESAEPCELKLSASVAAANRPKGMKYYEKIATVPMPLLVAEARRLMAIKGEPRRDLHDGSLTAIVNNASGGEKLVVTTLETPGGTVKTELVSNKPMTLWDWVAGSPGSPGSPAVAAAQPAPVVAANPPAPVIATAPPLAPVPPPIREEFATAMPRTVAPVPTPPPAPKPARTTAVSSSPYQPAAPTATPPLAVVPPPAPMPTLTPTAGPALPKLDTKPVLPVVAVTEVAPRMPLADLNAAVTPADRVKAIVALDPADVRRDGVAMTLVVVARADGTVDVRKAAIDALVRGQATQLPVVMALEDLTNDKVSAIRTAAAVALARLKTMPAGVVPVAAK